MKLSKLLPRPLRDRKKARRKAEERRRRVQQFNDSTSWRNEGMLAHRSYASYGDYVDHQASKLAGITDRLARKEARDFADFLQRFETCAPLHSLRSVLCLGARLGTEVKALHQLGYFAVGIDLNPGPDNSFVLSGDFHRIVFADGSIDAIYTNALDHAFDLAKILAEVRRLLRPGGIFIVDLVRGSEEGSVPGDFEALFWRTSDGMFQALRDLGQLDLVERRDLPVAGRQGQWRQAVFRKPVHEGAAETAAG